MTSKKKFELLGKLKNKGITTSQEFTKMDPRSVLDISSSTTDARAIFDLQNVVNADKICLFDYLMSDDKEDGKPAEA